MKVVGREREGSPAMAAAREKCPDLNLELRISPPYQKNQEGLKTGGRESSTLCFTCSTGINITNINRSKDCKCGDDNINGSSSTNNSGYDFLGLKGGVLDYRSLEMK